MPAEPPNDADRAQARRFAEELDREIAAIDHRLRLFAARLERLEKRRETLQAKRVHRQVRALQTERATLAGMYQQLRRRFRVDAGETEVSED